MRDPVSLCARRNVDGTVGNGAAEAIHSTAVVLWDVGVVLAIFLGLTIAVTATLTAAGIN